MIQMYLRDIHCHEETDEVGSDEPYVLVTSVDLTSTVRVSEASVPLPAFDVVLYGPWGDVDDEDTEQAPGASRSFWGVGGGPDALRDPSDAILLVSVMENDDGNANALRGVVKGVVGGSVLGSLSAPRPQKVAALIRDMDSAMGTPTGAPNFDDKVGGPQELMFSVEELQRAEAGEAVRKSMSFAGDGGRYELHFEARNPAYDWKAGSPIAAVARNPDHLDVFYIGPNGQVAMQWWGAAAGENWGDHPAFPITAPGAAAPGSPIAAVARNPDHLDVFYIGPNGQVAMQWWGAAAGENWGDHPAFPITAPGAAAPGR